MKVEIVLNNNDDKKKNIYPCLKISYYYNNKEKSKKQIVYFTSPRTGLCLYDETQDVNGKSMAGEIFSTWVEDNFILLQSGEKVILSND